MALWRSLRANRARSPSPVARKAPAKSPSGRGKRPKRLSDSLKCSRREGLRDCTNRLTASYKESTSEDYVPPYQWFCPERSLLERRNRTDQRRKELLQLLYREDEDGDSSDSDQIGDLVAEWVSLLVERDKLLHEQVNKDVCAEYFRELHRLLRAQPSLGKTSSEVNIRGMLMEFERCITEYCREKDLLSESQKPLTCSNTFAKPVFFHAPPQLPEDLPCTSKAQDQHPHHKERLLDHETGQASIRMEAASTSNRATQQQQVPLENDSSGSLFKEAAVAEIPVTECLYAGQAPTVVQSRESMGDGALRKSTLSRSRGGGLFDSLSVALSLHSEETSTDDYVKPPPPPPSSSSPSLGSGGHLPRPSPPPRPSLPPMMLAGSVSPPPPPLPPSPHHHLHSTLASHHQATASPTHGILPRGGGGSGSTARGGGGGGARGTVQFASTGSGNALTGPTATTASGPPRQQSSVATWKKRFFGIGRVESDRAASVHTEDRKNLLDEISAMGHTVLKRTNRPRTPGGTPVKVSPAPGATSGCGGGGGGGSSGDVLQRALITKFRSLHSTPLHQSCFLQQRERSGSLDFSNAWSDINDDDDSVRYEDPDITLPNSSFSSCSASGPGPGLGPGGVSGLLLSSSRVSRTRGLNSAHNSSSAV